MSKHNRAQRLMPLGIPKYIRCYDNGGTEVEGGTIDRYTVVYTGRYRRDDEQFMYVGMSERPTHPQGFCQHGFSDYQIDSPDGRRPPAIGKKNHLGTRIKFGDLPDACREVVMLEYLEIWRI
jgi:hypothetical protein